MSWRLLRPARERCCATITVMNLAGYQTVIAAAVDTALKVNISWHFFFPGSSTTPWQVQGVIGANREHRPSIACRRTGVEERNEADDGGGQQNLFPQGGDRCS